MLIYFINFCNINELINGEFNFSIEAVTDNADKKQKFLEQFFQKSYDSKQNILKYGTIDGYHSYLGKTGARMKSGCGFFVQEGLRFEHRQDLSLSLKIMKMNSNHVG